MPNPVSSDDDDDNGLQEQLPTIAALQAAQNAEQYRTLFSAVDVGLCIVEIVLDDEGRPVDYRFLEANPAFERHTGLVNGMGRTARELVPDLDAFWFRTYGNVALTGEPIRFESHAPAMGRWFDVYALRVGPAEERKVGILFTDITARKISQQALEQSEEQLRDAQARLESALSAGDTATWNINLAKCRVTGNSHLARLFFFDPESTSDEGLPLQNFLDAVHVEDRSSLTEAVTNSLEHGNAFDAEYRVVSPEGTERWISSRGKVARDVAGTVTSLYGTTQDITARKQIEQRERARLNDIFVQAPAFMAALRGPQHIFDMANPLYYQIVGHRDILGKSVAEALPEVVEQGFIGLLDQVYQTGEPFVGRDVSIMLQMKPSAPLEERFIDFTYQPLFDIDGSVSGILVHGIDRTIHKEQQQQLQDILNALSSSEERYRALVNSIDEGFCIIEMRFDAQGVPYDYLFLDTNPAFEQHTGLVDAIGKTIVELVPNIDPSWFSIYGNVARTGQSVRFENHDPALARWFDVNAQRVGNAEEGRVGIFFNDITARKKQQDALRQSEEQLRDAQKRLTAALSAGNIATWTLDIATNHLSPDANFAPLFGIGEEYATGRELDAYLAVIHPEDRQLVLDAIARAVKENVPYEAEYRVVLPDGSLRWFSARGTVEHDSEGKPVSMPGVIVDVTERIERESRERFLADLTVQTRALLDPEEILYETAKSIGEFTKAHRALYIEVNDDADQITIHRDYVDSAVDMPSMAGTFPMSAFGPPIVASLRAGNITESFDTETDPRLTPENRGIFRAMRFQSFLAVPLHKAGRFVAILALHQMQPRAWTPEEAELLYAVVERTWLAVENARLFRETQRRAEYEALLNQISAAVRGTLEPETILQNTVNMLGEGLHTDRCYFVRYDQTRDTARVSPEWYRADANIEPLVGRTFQMSAYEVNRDPSYRNGQTHAVDDVTAYGPDQAAALQSLNVHALLRVPIVVGDQMTALCVAMAHASRHWTEEQVGLVQNVASMVRLALESANIQKRERNIAQQLQDALQPTAPTNLPGMGLASFYRPALAEASVGGDFFDVFGVEKGCTALVVADLSGKGLAAAQQVATVRNMLRFALYKGRTVAEAVTDLHDALVEHDLLTGFATLFVGMYDQAQRTFTYVNCGQEPGLLRRAATLDIEQLPPTGPVLGGFAAVGGFEQKTVTLAVGDVLTLFTDGLTDVGPSRKNLLGVEGISTILRSCNANTQEACEPHTVVDELIAGVDAFARGGVGDDIALLVGVVQNG